MAESFFDQVFKDQQTVTPSKPSGPREGKAPPLETEKGKSSPRSGAPGPASGDEVVRRLAELEKQLSLEKERAMTYEIRFKEMQNAQSAVEELFEKTWAKKSKERMEEEMRLVRERSQVRVETLEKRLDDFQKSLLDMVRDSAAKTGRVREELAVEFKGYLENRVAEAVKSISSASPHEKISQLEAGNKSIIVRLQEVQEQTKDMVSKSKDILSQSLDGLKQRLEGKISALESMVSMGISEVQSLKGSFKKEMTSELDQLVSDTFKNMESRMVNRMGAFESAGASLRTRMSELEKVWHYLHNDLKALSAAVAASKGSSASLEAVWTAKMRGEFVEIRSQIDHQFSQNNARTKKEMEEHALGVLAKESKSVREALIQDIRQSLEFKQSRALEERMVETQKSVLGMGELTSALKSSIYQERDFIRKENESLWSQVRAANQTMAHLEETLRMVLKMVDNLRQGPNSPNPPTGSP